MKMAFEVPTCQRRRGTPPKSTNRVVNSLWGRRGPARSTRPAFRRAVSGRSCWEARGASRRCGWGSRSMPPSPVPLACDAPMARELFPLANDDRKSQVRKW